MVDKSSLQNSLDEKEATLNLVMVLFGIFAAIIGAILIITSFLFSPLFPYRDITLIIAGSFIGFFSLGVDEYIRNFPERKKLYSSLNSISNEIKTRSMT